MSRMEDLSGSIFSGSIPVSQSTHAFSINQSGNQVYISGQKTHSEETISKNGIQKNIHVVVKNSPFHITISTANRNLDLSRVAFDASLLYEEGGKEVDYVKAKPVELKTTPSEDGRDIDCEFRIKVLTSHHEDLLFKIKLVGHHPISKETVGIEVFTFPIKVISKPEQLKKRPPSKKRTLTDMLVETIARIEKKQEEQQSLIERVLTQQIASASTQPIISTPQFNFESEQSSKRLKHDIFWERMTDSEKDKDTKEKEKEKEKAKQSPDFEHAFVTMLRAYNSMSPEEKPETIRKMIRSSSTRETERLSELLDLFWTEGLSKERSFGQSSSSNSHSIHGSLEGCSCTECPHKVELERIDDFYKEFLQTSASMNVQTTF